MEEKHNVLYAALIIVGISLIGIIASFYYFQINDHQKNIISLYESQKFQEKTEKEKKAQLAKKKQGLLTKETKEKQELLDKKNKDKEELASEPDKSSQHKDSENSNKAKHFNKQRFIANSKNKPAPIPEAAIKKNKTKQNKECNKVKKYCPIITPSKEPEPQKTSETQKVSKTNIVSVPNSPSPNTQTSAKEQAPQENYANTPAYSYSNQPAPSYYTYSYPQAPQGVSANGQ